MKNNNPIKRFRMERDLTLESMADRVGLQKNALFLNECGVYSSILPAILDYMLKSDSYLREDRLSYEYRSFVIDKRRASGEVVGASQMDVGDVPAGAGSPLASLRNVVGMNKSRFSKEFCVHPAKVYSVEDGRSKHFGKQIDKAMTEAGFTGRLIDELNYRQEEYYEQCK